MSMVAALSVFCVVAVAAAEEQPPNPGPAAPRVLSSASRRFLVTGLSPATAQSLVVAADEALIRLEALVRQPVPFSRNQPIVLAARTEDGIRSGRVRKSQGWGDRGLAQRIDLVNVDQLDQEDLLEALTALLVNRYLVARQPPAARRSRPAEAPEWLTVGLAQNLYSTLRVRNAQLALKQWLDDAPLSVAELLDYRFLPPGRWSEKAFCGVFVDWLFSGADAARVWEGLLQRMVSSEPVTPGWLAERLLGNGDPRELEKHWELRIARRMLIRSAGPVLEADPVKELESWALIRPEKWGDAEAWDLPETMTLADLIERREEGWVPIVITGLEMELKHLGWGREEEFRRVLEAYDGFLCALRPVKPRGFLRWFRRRPSESVDLQKRLEAADRAFEEYRTRWEARRRVVDQAETAFRAPHEHLDEMRRRIPRSELQRYVDQVEAAGSTNR